MLGKVHRRGSRVGGLIRYLFGPGRVEEHINARLVAAWDGSGPLTDLEPALAASGKRDFRRLQGVLEAPVRAGRNPPGRYVWHASLRLAPEDRGRVLTDGMWGRMARDTLTEMGLVSDADREGFRWVVIRHSDDHVHIVATLVREDGRTEWAWNDRPRMVAAAYAVARRYQLRRHVPPADRSGHRRPGQAELYKARRQGRSVPARDELRGRVRTAAASASDVDSFFATLGEAGVLVRPRYSSVRPDEVTGYAVALPEATTAAGEPVFYSGGKLAADLTLPRLRRHWRGTTPEMAGLVWPPAARVQGLWRAKTALRTAATAIRRDALRDPAAAQATVTAAGDLLVSLAASMDGDGRLALAVQDFDRAARDLRAEAPAVAGRVRGRSLARLLAAAGRLSGEDELRLALQVVAQMARLADTVGWWREQQQRAHQVDAARRAAGGLRAVAAALPAVVAVTPASTPRVSAVEDGRRRGRTR